MHTHNHMHTHKIKIQLDFWQIKEWIINSGSQGGYFFTLSQIIDFKIRIQLDILPYKIVNY